MSFIGCLCTSPAVTWHGMCAQVFKKKDVDADELMGLSSAKRGGKKSKKGAEKPAEKPVRPLPPDPALPLEPRMHCLFPASCLGAWVSAANPHASTQPHKGHHRSSRGCC